MVCRGKLGGKKRVTFVLYYLAKEHGPAHDTPEEPGLRDVPQNGRRQADDQDEKVRHSQVHDEMIGDAAHGGIADHREYDQDVAHGSH